MWRRGAVSAAVVGLVGGALGYGIAQGMAVTQAEWAVYMAQGLGLDWNLPPNAKSNHYLARLDWTNSIEFGAGQMMDGSTAETNADGSISADAGAPTEALYEMATLRPGDYGFRVKMGGGGALLKVADQAFEMYQPDSAPRWVDLNRVPLDPGDHQMSLMVLDGARVESLAVSPPCMVPVEPVGGWDPLKPLTFDELAVTVARALDLEKHLPELGEPMTIRGEDFQRTLVYPYEDNIPTGEDEPYWLSSGGSIVTAVARFKVPEAGVYSIETRYLSDRPLRWNMDSCLRVVTCPVSPNQTERRRSMALELDAGEHELEVTLPPRAKLDRIEIQRREASSDEYMRVVSDEGFKLGDGEEEVKRRDAMRAARRLRDRFLKLTQTRCQDSLIAMEAEAVARALQSSTEADVADVGNSQPPSSPQVPSGEPLFPPVVDVEERDPASPVQP